MGKRNDKVNPQRKRVRFTKQFKLEAVRLLERGENPPTLMAFIVSNQR
jgi:transposase